MLEAEQFDMISRDHSFADPLSAKVITAVKIFSWKNVRFPFLPKKRFLLCAD